MSREECRSGGRLVAETADTTERHRARQAADHDELYGDTEAPLSLLLLSSLAVATGTEVETLSHTPRAPHMGE